MLTEMRFGDAVYHCTEEVAEDGRCVMECAELEVKVEGLTQADAELRFKEACSLVIRGEGKTLHQLRVERFMRLVFVRQKAVGAPITQAVRVRPSADLNFEERCLRARLMLEEVLETIQKGLGLYVTLNGEDDYCVNIDGVDFEDNDQGGVNLVALADGVADIKVTATGTLSACGIRDDMIQVIVDAANLRKFGEQPDGSIGMMRPDGKWIKPTGFVGPEAEIAEELRKQSGQIDPRGGIPEAVPQPLLNGL